MGKGFVKFEKEENEPYESVYDVKNKSGWKLGKIFFKPEWKKHIFEPYQDTYFDTVCLKHISEFLIKLDAKYKDGFVGTKEAEL